MNTSPLASGPPDLWRGPSSFTVRVQIDPNRPNSYIKNINSSTAQSWRRKSNNNTNEEEEDVGHVNKDAVTGGNQYVSEDRVQSKHSSSGDTSDDDESDVNSYVRNQSWRRKSNNKEDNVGNWVKDTETGRYRYITKDKDMSKPSQSGDATKDKDISKSSLIGDTSEEAESEANANEDSLDRNLSRYTNAKRADKMKKSLRKSPTQQTIVNSRQSRKRSIAEESSTASKKRKISDIFDDCQSETDGNRINKILNENKTFLISDTEDESEETGSSFQFSHQAIDESMLSNTPRKRKRKSDYLTRDDLELSGRREVVSKSPELSKRKIVSKPATTSKVKEVAKSPDVSKGKASSKTTNIVKASVSSTPLHLSTRKIVSKPPSKEKVGSKPGSIKTKVVSKPSGVEKGKVVSEPGDIRITKVVSKPANVSNEKTVLKKTPNIIRTKVSSRTIKYLAELPGLSKGNVASKPSEELTKKKVISKQSEARKEVESDNKRISFKIVFKEKTLLLKKKKNSRLLKTKNKEEYAKSFEKPVNSLRFVFKEKKIKDSDTPGDLGMVDGDTIEVHQKQPCITELVQEPPNRIPSNESGDEITLIGGNQQECEKSDKDTNSDKNVIQISSDEDTEEYIEHDVIDVEEQARLKLENVQPNSALDLALRYNRVYIEMETMLASNGRCKEITQIGAFKENSVWNSETRFFKAIEPKKLNDYLENYKLGGDLLQTLHMQKNDAGKFEFRKQFEIMDEGRVAEQCVTEEQAFEELSSYLATVENCIIISLNQENIQLLINKFKLLGTTNEEIRMNSVKGFCTWSSFLKESEASTEDQNREFEDWYENYMRFSSSSEESLQKHADVVAKMVHSSVTAVRTVARSHQDVSLQLVKASRPINSLLLNQIPEEEQPDSEIQYLELFSSLRPDFPVTIPLQKLETYDVSSEDEEDPRNEQDIYRQMLPQTRIQEQKENLAEKPEEAPIILESISGHGSECNQRTSTKDISANPVPNVPSKEVTPRIATNPKCSICHNVFTTITNRNAHIIDKHNPNNFDRLPILRLTLQCQECFQWFPNLNEKNSSSIHHCNSQNPKIPVFLECQHCKRSFKTYEEKTAHRLECNPRTTTKDIPANPVPNIPSKEVTPRIATKDVPFNPIPNVSLECKGCKRTFKTSNEKTVHMLTCNERNAAKDVQANPVPNIPSKEVTPRIATKPKCSICHNVFTTITNRNAHIIDKHNPNNFDQLPILPLTLQCQECYEWFPNLNEKNSSSIHHCYRQNPKIPVFLECKHCKRSFKTFNAKTVHMLTCNERNATKDVQANLVPNFPFECQLCKRCFKTYEEKTAHFLKCSPRTATKDVPPNPVPNVSLECRHCKRSFKTYAEKTAHFLKCSPRTASKDPRTASNDPGTTSNDPRTTSNDPRTTSKDPRTASNDPGTTSNDPRTTSNDPRTGTKDSITVTNDIPAAPVSNVPTKETTPIETGGGFTIQDATSKGVPNIPTEGDSELVKLARSGTLAEIEAALAKLSAMDKAERTAKLNHARRWTDHLKRDWFGDTAIIAAAKNGNVKILAALLTAGADPTLTARTSNLSEDAVTAAKNQVKNAEAKKSRTDPGDNLKMAQALDQLGRAKSTLELLVVAGKYWNRASYGKVQYSKDRMNAFVKNPNIPTDDVKLKEDIEAFLKKAETKLKQETILKQLYKKVDEDSKLVEIARSGTLAEMEAELAKLSAMDKDERAAQLNHARRWTEETSNQRPNLVSLTPNEWFGETAIIAAVRKGKVKMVAALLAAGADPTLMARTSCGLCEDAVTAAENQEKKAVLQERAKTTLELILIAKKYWTRAPNARAQYDYHRIKTLVKNPNKPSDENKLKQDIEAFLRKIEESKQESSLKCSICNIDFTTTLGRNLHIKNKHNPAMVLPPIKSVPSATSPLDSADKVVPKGPTNGRSLETVATQDLNTIGVTTYPSSQPSPTQAHHLPTLPNAPSIESSGNNMTPCGPGYSNHWSGSLDWSHPSFDQIRHPDPDSFMGGFGQFPPLQQPDSGQFRPPHPEFRYTQPGFGPFRPPHPEHVHGGAGRFRNPHPGYYTAGFGGFRHPYPEHGPGGAGLFLQPQAGQHRFRHPPPQ